MVDLVRERERTSSPAVLPLAFFAVTQLGVFALGVLTEGGFPGLWMITASAASALGLVYALDRQRSGDASAEPFSTIGILVLFALWYAIVFELYSFEAVRENWIQVGMLALATAWMIFSKRRKRLKEQSEVRKLRDSEGLDPLAIAIYLLVAASFTLVFFSSGQSNNGDIADSVLRLTVAEWSSHRLAPAIGLLLAKFLALPVLFLALWKLPTPGRAPAGALVLALFSLAAWWNLRPWLAGAGPEHFAWGHLILTVFPVLGMLALIAPRRDRLSRTQTMSLGIWAALWLFGPAFPNWPS